MRWILIKNREFGGNVWKWDRYRVPQNVFLFFFTEFGIQNQWSPNLQNKNRSLSMSFEVTAGLFLSIMGPNGRFSLCGIPQLLRQVYNGVTSAKPATTKTLAGLRFYARTAELYA